jgi:formylglycine-generating enzyme required for sulfatase activity
MALGGESGAYFSFGSQEWHDAQFQTALSSAKEENAKMEDMKDALGEETFGMIQEQLLARGKKPMQAEKKTPQTLDGGAEADLRRIEPFAIDATAVSVAQFRAFVKATKYKTEAETFGWRARPAPLTRKSLPARART